MSDTSGTHKLTGILESLTVTAEAAANQNPTGNVVYDILGQVSTFDISSNTNSTVVVDQFVTVLDTINLATNGGTIIMGSGFTIGETVNATISGGGDYVAATEGFNIFSGAGSIGFSGTGGTLTLGKAGDYGTTTEKSTISGFTVSTDTIDDQSLKFSSITGYTVTGTGTGPQTITVNDGPGNFSFTTNNAGLADGTYTRSGNGMFPANGPIAFAADKSGGTTIGAVCFVRGTRIATPDGETEVESLNAGDLVATRENGETVFRPVTWVGHRSIDVSRMQTSVDAHPVRIRAGAFAANVPHRDLLVTPDHCVFVDGRLIPSRMLVNGGSIIADTSISKYEFFHVELERHAILVSEGLETESYLDTGNRGNFANAEVSSVVPDFGIDAAQQVWATRSAAPLAVDRETVEPIWQRLMARSSALGFDAGPISAVSHDPDIRVMTDTGLSLRPTLRDGRTATFVVPGGARSLRLVSNAARPSEMVGPFVDDRRELGVLVGAIGIATGHRRRVASAVGVAASLGGWHAAEPGSAYRWTDGDAELPLDMAALGGASVVLDIEVVHAGPYPVREAIARAA